MKELSEIKRKELLTNGIYKIINIKNNKFYIGSCSSKTFLYERLKHHQQDLFNNKHCNIYLQNSFNKYGINNFYYEIIEICKPEDCIIREQYWIDLLKPHYNLCKKAGSSFGIKCSIEKAKKISDANKNFWSIPENKERMKTLFKTRIYNKDRKKGYKNPNYKLSEKGKEILKEKSKKKIINLDTNEIYSSLKEASEKLNINYSYLSGCLNNKRNSKGKRRKLKCQIKFV